MIMGTFDFTEEKQTIIVVVIEKENLERMQTADPISLESLKAGGILQPARFPFNMSLLIAYEEDHDHLVKLAQGPAVAFLQYLERGRRFIPGVDGAERTMPIAGKSAKEQA